MKLPKVLGNALEFADKKSPAILTGLAIAGIVSLAAMNVAPKVKKIMENHKEKIKEVESNADLTEEEFKKAKNDICADTAKNIAKDAIPTMALAIATGACALGAHTISARRVAALSAAYEITSKGLSDLKDSISEIAPKKAKEIEENAAIKRMGVINTSNPSEFYATNNGNIPCVDIYTKKKFLSSHEAIVQAIRDLSDDLKDGYETFISVSDLYYKLGIYNTDIPPVARDIGWTVDDLTEGDGDGHRMLPIMLVTTWDESGTVPVIGIDYEIDVARNAKEGGRFRR